MSRVRILSSKAVLTSLILLIWNPVVLCSQSGGTQTAAKDNLTVDWVNQKTSAIRAFVGPTPDEYHEAIDEKKQVLRATVMLDGSTTVEFYEKPKDIDFYDSTIVINRHGMASRSYNLGELIKHQALSLAHVAIVPTGNGTGMLVCEYEGGAVGAREGFAILRFSPSSFDLHTLPLTNFGKVVVFKEKPDHVEIWSALPDGAASDADPMAYSTQACHWKTKGYVCGPPKRKRGRFSPAATDSPGIEIRP